MEETVVEMELQGVATASGEGERSSRQPLDLKTTPEASMAPNPPWGAPRGELGESSRGVKSLALISRVPLGGLCGADAIQAAHLCLDQLSASLVVEEQRLSVECAVEEEKCQAEEAECQHYAQVREDAQEIRAGAAHEVEERLAQVEQRELALDLREQVYKTREESLHNL
jgi:hypothetical protein